MCETFPIDITCNIDISTRHGLLETKNGYCILPNNVYNAILYFFLWHMYMILFLLSSIYVVCLLLTCMSNKFRYKILLLSLPAVTDEATLHALKQNLQNYSIQKFLVLYQIVRNVPAEKLAQILIDLQPNYGSEIC